ncbi:hypothetical protein JTE90_028670 [Oedothorax gibbosus]|uniref:Uncharacterized protein n=1 Tax=Oedothorax gibbosus TaxID=931172 RepID=A0AAV6TN19_9ARAC|nr:hypothetical protein JTE90_028670 [Oedothorax gibbosus]
MAERQPDSCWVPVAKQKWGPDSLQQLVRWSCPDAQVRFRRRTPEVTYPERKFLKGDTYKRTMKANRIVSLSEFSTPGCPDRVKPYFTS